MWIRMGNERPAHIVTPDEDFPSMKKPQLVERARQLGLDQSGDEGDLQDRLMTYQDLYGRENDAPCVMDFPSIPPDMSFAEVLDTIVRPNGAWDNQSSRDENGKVIPPLWVASDDEQAEAFLARHYGCERGIPDDLEETHYTAAGPPGVDGSTGEDDK